ncbi:RNA polymerase sigma factor [Persicitalea jodogahamensis]|uniref:DNA-directed RNA polymerase sigma-70 factor n=1 Tax=Persicitalea jodogahamensis TaxID=402147 RepID=A0A8J3D674_9BACT|nr:RNA polymerase sigma factor [Persicitalea jodogahamensis]GHB55751.1 DNA-directed RNA polymerase sigma-70 factor [Persicitalea jodogahamensis]
MSEHNSAAILDLLDGCLQGNRRSQELLYKQFYGYAMSLCMRYARSRDEAQEILNDGFFKVFTKLETYDQKRPFKTWLGRVLINTALDQYRREAKHQVYEDIRSADNVAAVNESAVSRLIHEELLELIQLLPPAYRMVFSLAVLDGYTHEEIAAELEISVGASKSNLSRARGKLKEMLAKKSMEAYERVVR